MLQDLIYSSEDLPHDVSECEHFNITTKSVLDAYPPMVEDAKCALFCEYVKSLDIDSRYEPIILQIKYIYLADENIDENNHIHLAILEELGWSF